MSVKRFSKRSCLLESCSWDWTVPMEGEEGHGQSFVVVVVTTAAVSITG